MSAADALCADPYVCALIVSVPDGPKCAETRMRVFQALLGALDAVCCTPVRVPA
jgi:hypothetical protein